MSYTLYFDGASRNNPGESACGVVVYKGDNLAADLYHYMGEGYGNNMAEYQALILGLQLVQKVFDDVEVLVCRGDSLVVIQQMKDLWAIRNKTLIDFYVLAQTAAEEFDNISFEHVQRDANSKADLLANKGIVMKKAFTRTYKTEIES